MPEIAPVELFKLKPAGSAGVIEKLLLLTPPEAVIGVKVVAAMPEVSELALIAVDADNGATTRPVAVDTRNKVQPGVPGALFKTVEPTPVIETVE